MNKPTELATPKSNGSGRMAEIGTPGIEVYSGFVMQADNVKLFWPAVWPLYNRLLRRSDVVAQWRELTTAMVSGNTLYWESPLENPSDADLRFVEFLHTIWDDIPGGSQKLMETWAAYILAGWMWFENVPARRDGKKATGADWVSVYDDELIGLRDVAFRHHGSFHKWEFKDNNHLYGFVQRDDSSNAGWEVTIPLPRSTHVTLGDRTNPEGLSPFEALWRPENLRHNYEIVMGIGIEASAGKIIITSEQQLTTADKATIERNSRALMAAQEGNFGLFPSHLSVENLNIPFPAAATTLDAIKYYEHLMAKILGIQWMSLSLTGDAGSNASMFTAAGMWLKQHNIRVSGAAAQIGEQLASQLRRYNMAQFGSVKRLPILKATPVETNISLSELAQFVTTVWPLIEITPEDEAALRRASDFLPEKDMAEISEDETDDTEPATAQDNGEDETAVPETDNEGESDFAHPVTIGDEQITVTDEDDLIGLADDEELDRLYRDLKRWSENNGVNLDKFFNAEAVESDSA